MIEEAQGLRARVLADLARRRKVLHVQIEQLRAGRERLADTVHDVRRSVDTIAEDLFAAEDNARLAAEAAGREALGRPDEGTPEELAALLIEEEADATAGRPPAGPAARGGARRRAADPVAAEPEPDDESPVDALFAKIRAPVTGPIAGTRRPGRRRRGRPPPKSPPPPTSRSQHEPAANGETPAPTR